LQLTGLSRLPASRRLCSGQMAADASGAGSQSTGRRS
jgi:hypothetical protein